MYFWLRLRLRDILLTTCLGGKNGNSIREQYILTSLEPIADRVYRVAQLRKLVQNIKFDVKIIPRTLIY